MAAPMGASGDIPDVTFTVPTHVVMIKRGSEISLGAYGLVTIAVFFPWGGPPPPDSIDHIVWPVLAVGVLAPAAFVWFRWNRIPKGAPGGTLRIGSDGIVYQVGPDHVRLDWSQVAGVFAIGRPGKPGVYAVWLPREDRAPPNSSRTSLLEIAHVKSPYRPVERPDGVLLPLTLFGTDKATPDTITNVLSRGHVRAVAAIQQGGSQGA